MPDVMARPSREARQDAALLELLNALPEARLTGILEALGVPVDAEPTKRRDPRRCLECGKPYVVCRTIAEKSGDDHPFKPDRSRSDQ